LTNPPIGLFLVDLSFPTSPSPLTQIAAAVTSPAADNALIILKTFFPLRFPSNYNNAAARSQQS
jgi:hypothetical protein